MAELRTYCSTSRCRPCWENRAARFAAAVEILVALLARTVSGVCKPRKAKQFGRLLFDPPGNGFRRAQLAQLVRNFDSKP